MAFDEINAKGGVLGKKIEPVVVDPASNWPLFAEKARQLIWQARSSPYSAVDLGVAQERAPVFEELNGLLFYPVQYEGEELSKNVFYTARRPTSKRFRQSNISCRKTAAVPSALCCWARTTSIRAPPIKFCAPF